MKAPELLLGIGLTLGISGGEVACAQRQHLHEPALGPDETALYEAIQSYPEVVEWWQDIQDLPDRDKFVAWLALVETYGGERKIEEFNVYLQRSEAVKGIQTWDYEKQGPIPSFCPFQVNERL